MAHFWNLDRSGRWLAQLASEVALDKSFNVVEASDNSGLSGEQRLVKRLAQPPETWVALCPPHFGLRVNGQLVPMGIAVLSDRDELGVPGRHACFFSTETVAHTQPFPESTGSCCPRCKLAIESGSAAIRCPDCGLWHHATDEMPCWTYAPTCAGCAQPTAPDAGFRWTPEDL